MSVYIRADGNQAIGLGHLVRCMALAQMLESKFEIVFVCQSVPEHTKQTILNEGFLLKGIREEADFLNLISKGDIAVLDGYAFDENLQKQIKETGALLVCIDDLYEKEFVADLIINHAPNVKPENYKVKPETKLLLGPDFALLRSSFLEQAQQKRVVDKMASVLICFGGSDFKNLTQSCLETALEFKDFNRIFVITGAAYQTLEDLKPVLESDARISHFHAISENEMLEIMKQSDLAVVPSSGILSEVLACGCQVVSGMYVDNQKFIYEAYSDANSFYDAADFNPESLKKAILEAIQNQKQTINPIDGKSGKRLLKAFENLKMKQDLVLRKATEADTTTTFGWAKDPEVRKFSFSQDEILWSGHEKWFHSKVNSENCVYLIAEIDGKPAGSIRFDISDAVFTISYLLGPEFHGFGLGKVLLEKGIAFIRAAANENQQHYKIVGFVIPQNISSLKAFRGLGFDESADGENSKFEISI